MKISTINVRQKDFPSFNHKPIKGFEFIIDNIPLAEWINNSFTDLITKNEFTSVLVPSNFNLYIKKMYLGQSFLLPKEAEKTYFVEFYQHAIKNEIILYTCPCGDIVCGGLITKMEKISINNTNVIKWDCWEPLSPFYFNEIEYEKVIEKVFSEILLIDKE